MDDGEITKIKGTLIRCRRTFVSKMAAEKIHAMQHIHTAYQVPQPLSH